jgi:hypothetical protein
MSILNDLSLYHVRSSQACISAGYRLYMGCFRKLLRRTWIWGLLYALIAAAVMNQFLQVIPFYSQISNARLHGQTLASGFDLPEITVWNHCVTIAYYIVSFLFFSTAFTAFSEHKETSGITPPAKWYGVTDWRTTLRMLKLLLWQMLLFLAAILLGALLMVVVLMFAKPSILLVFAMIGVLTIIVMFFMLPLVYTNYKYMLTPGSRFLGLLGHTYGIGLRHWGSIFLVMLMVGIVMLVLSAVIMLPYYILLMALTKSQMGTLMGDPLGMPDYMGTMSTIVFAVAAFVMAYLNMSSLFPFYYLFGSFETEEEERNQLKTNLE